MRTQVQKWGNSLAVRIPKALAEDLGIGRNATVELAVEDGSLVMRPFRPHAVRLDALLAGVTADNLHREADWGAAVGGEEW